ncbi:CBM21 domain-containing protein [Inconstantimicrobium mannanitabidum]|uniref:Glycogen-binding regulatory subunit of S/T protein phosphatase I n=1 Tax=Inconstantimicrobium mannanitabidum TaxID=1604901 RepID=A0ACB5RFZ8_9CLOT|nr:CBM21 domain-containing protein [Clostridium sp. TW13]GKX68021.1 glycogen-binding regulatory subunit of S/T protein phosphatase I [Clostridium sp. TW13]
MKISKKIFSFITSVLVLATTLTFGNAVSAKADTNDVPVQLYYSYGVADSGETGHYTGYIAIKNLAYDKKVTVHYNYTGPQASNVWNDVTATYVKTNPLDGYEIWKFETPVVFTHYGFGQIQYCIRYDVNGQTYWDNNNSKNYVGNDFASSRPHMINYGQTSENNKDYMYFYVGTKKSVNPEAVRIRYSEDNWATYKDVDSVKATDIYYSDDTNCWYIKVPVSSGKQIKFSAYYVLNGVQYCDNNLGDNYVFNN